MKTLVIGKNGQLGSELIRLIDGSIGTVRNRNSDLFLDLGNPSGIEDTILKISPDVIINAAAVTDVDGCESNITEAYKINGLAVKSMARAASVIGSYFIQISTDYVFDGSKGMYTEADTPEPVNYYGLSKLIGETFALSYDDSLVIRSSGIYGKKMNFPLYVAMTLKANGTVNCIDSFYSPIHATQLAYAIREIISRRIYGIVNISGPRISKYEFAEMIKERLNIRTGKIVISRSSEMKAKRPYDSSLDNSKAKKILNYRFDDIEEGIKLLQNNFEST